MHPRRPVAAVVAAPRDSAMFIFILMCMCMCIVVCIAMNVLSPEKAVALGIWVVWTGIQILALCYPVNNVWDALMASPWKGTLHIFSYVAEYAGQTIVSVIMPIPTNTWSLLGTVSTWVGWYVRDRRFWIATESLQLLNIMWTNAIFVEDFHAGWKAWITGTKVENWIVCSVVSSSLIPHDKKYVITFGHFHDHLLTSLLHVWRDGKRY